MNAYYNENDPFCVQWLRNLIADGHLPAGEVDDRSIEDVASDDLTGFSEHHFFAGIGGWPYALRLAGWEGPVWTGSCPCQPFSAAGKRQGEADARHLWPVWGRLIAECRPATVFGEQVASALGREWLAGVRADLEGMGYACGGADLCAAGVGAPHIRQRLWWVARGEEKCGIGGELGGEKEHATERGTIGRCASNSCHSGANDAGDAASTGSDGLGNTNGARLAERGSDRGVQHGTLDASPWQAPERAGWIDCADGKARRVEPSIFPLADGFPNRVGTLRGAGNAIVPQVAAEFVSAFMEVQR